MRKYHPDKNADPNSTTRAQALNAAFAIVGDPAKRRAYDSTRKAASGFKSSPPPPPQEPNFDPLGSNYFKLKGLLFHKKSIGFIAAVAVVLFFIASQSRHPDNMQAMQTDGANDSSGAESSNDPSGDPFETALGGKPSEGKNPAAQPTLKSQYAPANIGVVVPLNFNYLEEATQIFDRALRNRGIVGARIFSEACHKDLTLHPSWSAADVCTAFDIAAAHFDAGMVKVASGAIRQDNYFRFKDENASDSYTQFGISPYFVQERIATIRRAVGPTVDDVVLSRLNREQATPNVSPSVSAPSWNANGAIGQ